MMVLDVVRRRKWTIKYTLNYVGQALVLTFIINTVSLRFCSEFQKSLLFGCGFSCEAMICPFLFTSSFNKNTLVWLNQTWLTICQPLNTCWEKKNPSIFTSPRPGQMNSKGPSKSLPFSATASLEPSVTESMPPSQVTSAVPSPTGQRHVQIEDIPDKEPEVEKPKKPGTIAVSWLFLRNHFLTRNNLRMRFFKQWNSFEIDLLILL